MSRPRRVMVLGATGFVGAAVVSQLRAAGHEVVAVRAPRHDPVQRERARPLARSIPLDGELVQAMSDCTAVVNAAGNPDASLRDEAGLNAANALLPGVLARAAAQACPSPRFVHVSSAVVQGRVRRLDTSPADAVFSAYARSKVLGEQLAVELGPDQTVVYRPPSVHAEDRRVTRTTARIARSPLAVVAAPGTQPTPQALLPNVAAAVSFLATTEQRPPHIVTHPSEGLTVAGLMELLGERTPRRLPRALARSVTGVLAAAGHVLPGVAANARRVEMILFGQAQATSWLTEVGWTPPLGPDAWRALGTSLTPSAPHNEGRTT